MTQATRVYQYMKTQGSITQNEASKEFGCTDLAGAVYKLKKQGVEIGDTWTTARNRFGEYVRFKRYFLIDREAE